MLPDLEVRFFGEPWPSGICDIGVQVPTPVGEFCALCATPIEEDHRGTFIGVVAVGEQPVHCECSLRSVIGGIGHLNGSSSCPCRGGDDPDDGHSYRESALLVWQWVQRHGFGL